MADVVLMVAVPRNKTRLPTLPTRTQVKVTEEVARWYLQTYFRRDEEPGSAGMFYDSSRVGHFAVTREEVRRGDGRALFRLLIATSLFQRQRDQQVLSILRGIDSEDARDLTDSERLVALAGATGCSGIKTVQALAETCDLTKSGGVGVCAFGEGVSCHLKRHSVLLRRYGHFGKVPTSSALVIAEAGYRSLGHLLEAVATGPGTPHERALAVEAQLSNGWRVSEKIAAMYMSMLVDPDIAVELVPWAAGLEHEHFVVIDSNVDLFLKSIGYSGLMTYAARREFIQRLAHAIDMRQFNSRVQRSYSPRLLQQALYVFMGASNRREVATDCSKDAPRSCSVCPRRVRDRCPWGHRKATAKSNAGED